tara:strand:- start:748 stop:1584 length:837 start_codon:yes stop_codon:yes gene_type:complete
MLLLQGDCLELLKEIPDESVDLIFCDLPYGQTNCKWDCKVDLEKLWSEFLRVKKLNTPLFFTTTTKFGVELINSAPKKCPFRYDIVWAKSSSTGFLLAKKMPLRRHEMVYVFYEKLPFYDLSSHQHKFVKEYNDFDNKDGAYGVIKSQKGHPEPLYDPPLPTSVVKSETIYNNVGKETTPLKKHPVKGETTGQPRYDPPLPHSLVEIKSSRGKHSTEKPVALMEWILKYYSKEGDVVLDPTMGSGSMGVACENLNRDFIGFELDEKIFEEACERLIPS